VQGFGSGNFSGVAGFGGSTDGIGDGTGVFGIGGGTGGPGVRGIGAGGPNRGPDPRYPPNVGVFGQGGDSGADGVQGAGPRGEGAVVSAGVRGIATDPEGSGIVAEIAVPGNSPNAIAILALANAGALGEQPSGYAGFFEGQVFVNGDFHVFGAKSAVVPFSDGSLRRLYSMESPESWFEDFGIGHLVNGQAEVQLDSDFASVVNSDNYHVFVNEYDDNNALYVTRRTSTGFGVRAKSSKTASGTFSYRVVAKRKDIAGKRLERVVIPTEKLQAARSARLARQKK
jgi:hypothetical protein